MMAQVCAVTAAVVFLVPGLLGLWRPGRRRYPAEAAPPWPERAETDNTSSTRRGSQASWAATLERLARDTGGGAALAAAIGEVAARSDAPAALQETARAWRTGVPLADAVPPSANGVDPDERLALEVVRVLATQGGPPGAPLDRAASVLRERRTLAEERRAQAAQADLSAKVLSVVPVAFAGLSAAADRGLAHVLLATPLGWACLLAGGALDVIGWRWMRRIVNRP